MAGNLEFIKSASGSNVALLDITDCFSNEYETYKVVYDYVRAYDISGYVRTRLLDSTNTVIDASEYDYAELAMRSYNTFFENRGTNNSQFSIGYSYDYNTGGGEMTIFNPYNSSSYTFVNNSNAGGTILNGDLFGYKNIAVHKSAEQINGLRILVTGGGSFDFNEITIKVYGVK